MRFYRIQNRDLIAVRCFDVTGIAYLTTHFSIEWGHFDEELVVNNHALPTFRDQLIETDEPGFEPRRSRIRQLHDFSLLRCPGTSLLLFHELIEAADVHCKATLTSHELREVERETIGIVQFESEFAGKHIRPCFLAWNVFL